MEHLLISIWDISYRIKSYIQETMYIVLPWGKYEYHRFPMGLCNSPDIFQEKMGEIKVNLAFVRAYIDDLIILTKDTWEITNNN